MAALDWRDMKRSGLANARLYVQANAPYFGSTLYGMTPMAVEGLLEQGGPMACTEQLVLLFDPDWVEKEDELILATGLAHEVLHSQLKFFQRVQQYGSPEDFNLAQDIAMNQWLRAQQKPGKPGGPMWRCADWFAQPELYGFPPNLTADHYYQLLQKDKKDGKAAKKGSGSGQDQVEGAAGSTPKSSGTGNAPGDNDAGVPGGMPKGSPQGGNRPGSGAPRIGRGGCGGIAGNPIGRELERRANEQQGRTPQEVQRVARETARAIRQAQEQALRQGRGLFPGSFVEILGAVDQEEKVRWEDVLQDCIRSAVGRAKTGGLDYSLSRPSRRSMLRGWPIPGLIKRDFVAAVVVDSSDSMSKEQLKRAVAETAGVLRQTGIEKLWLLIVDAAVAAAPREITIWDLENLEIPGRGGTSFVPGIEAVQKLEPRPDVTIYLTDGDGAATKEPPEEMEFIWGLIRPYRKAPPAPWGEVVNIE